MVRNPAKSLVLVLSAVLILGITSADVFGQTPLAFDLNGSGSISGDPPVFQGLVSSGPMAGGMFVIEIDDTGWPIDNPGTPQDERWDFILATYFVYDPIYNGKHWDGTFPASGSLYPVVTWRFTDGADRVGGIIVNLIITIADTDNDGIVDQDELGNQQVAGNFIAHIEQSAGVWDDHCGAGSCNGSLENYDPGMDDILTIGGTLYMRDFSCAVPVKNTTWGIVKELYR
jgi:hypothetical protein